jgi:broad specificity phosphatase PhoE
VIAAFRLLALGALGALSPTQGSPFAEVGPPPAGTLHVYLVRHAQAFSNLSPAPEMTEEQLDRLTPLGREQVAKTARVLAERGVKLVLSSPTGRARQTAAQLRDAIRAADLKVEPRLRPLELGKGADGKQLAWDARIADWKAGRDPSPAGGESLADLGRRVLAVARDLHRERSGRGVLLIAHSDVISAFLGEVEAVPGAKRYPFAVRNASISLVEIGRDGKARLLFANHLPDELAPPP